MPRQSDINSAFHAAIQLNPKGYRCLRSSDFIRELASVHHHFTLADANEWIELYQTGFVDKTPDDSENRFWILRNMGQVF
ncbi:hypothetical protein [Leclercia sp. W17]|uniref:hypothetical protein n=1 Tax=Leclercia sp. W17 TaxID=2282309 RepID=UPI000DF2949C|nr:hypothetical protein [Leclercia sp. W17]AXF65219.1 hypothetical protein DVA44_14475 [Leclercia sp. W17]